MQHWRPAWCLMMGGKWYMFWCVVDFFVRPHGHMVGIVLWQPLIGIRHWSSLTSCRLKKDMGQHINVSMLWRCAVVVKTVIYCVNCAWRWGTDLDTHLIWRCMSRPASLPVGLPWRSDLLCALDVGRELSRLHSLNGAEANSMLSLGRYSNELIVLYVLLTVLNKLYRFMCEQLNL